MCLVDTTKPSDARVEPYHYWFFLPYFMMMNTATMAAIIPQKMGMKSFSSNSLLSLSIVLSHERVKGTIRISSLDIGTFLVKRLGVFVGSDKTSNTSRLGDSPGPC